MKAGLKPIYFLLFSDTKEMLISINFLNIFGHDIVENIPNGI